MVWSWWNNSTPILIHRILSHVPKKSVMENFILCTIVKHKKRVKLLSILHSTPIGVDAQRCSVKKLLLKISQNWQENTFTGVCFLIKLQAYEAHYKEALKQVFFCEFCEISKNTFSYRTPLVAASAPCKN